MSASQTRPVYKTLADHVIGCASLANVERALEEATSLLGSLAMGGTDAVTPMMTLTQSFDLLLVEFHVHLVLARPRNAPVVLTLHRGGRGVCWMRNPIGRMTREQMQITGSIRSRKNMMHQLLHM